MDKKDSELTLTAGTEAREAVLWGMWKQVQTPGLGEWQEQIVRVAVYKPGT